MYQKYIVVLIYGLVAAVLSSFGCNSSSYKKVTSNDVNPYFPSENGNMWEYINEAPREETELFKVEITRIIYEGKDLIVELNAFPFFSGNEEKSKLRIKPNGEVYYVNKQSQKDELFMPEVSDFNKGYQWQFGQWTGFIGGTKEKVKAENETFNDCIFLNFSISFTFSAEVWVAKDKGIVKWGYNRTNPPTPKPKYYVLNKMSLAK